MSKRTVALLVAVCVLIVSSVMIFDDFKKMVLSREIISYHVNDLHCKVFDLKEQEVIEYKRFVRDDNEKYLKGIAAGRNLIVIQVESLQNFPINRKYNGQEITPFLNRLIKNDSIYSKSYYQQLGKGNTSDAEFVTNNSLYPSIYGQSYTLYEKNHFEGLPKILKDQGYSVVAMHGYKKDFWNREKAYVHQGFERFYSESDYLVEETIGMGISDKAFFKQSLEKLERLDKPFYSFMVTLTNHIPYILPDNQKRLEIKEEDKGTLFANHLQTLRYTDESIEAFVLGLKEKNMYKDSVVAIYGDHFGLKVSNEENLRPMQELLGYEYSYDEMLKVPLIIHIPESGVEEEIQVVGGQIDFMPTLLNLYGLDHPNDIYFGQDLVNAKEGFVASQTYLSKGSFITDDILFKMSEDKILEHSKAWDLKTHELVSVKNKNYYYEKAIREINQSNYILENNVLKYVRDKNFKNMNYDFLVEHKDKTLSDKIRELFK